MGRNVARGMETMLSLLKCMAAGNEEEVPGRCRNYVDSHTPPWQLLGHLAGVACFCFFAMESSCVRAIGNVGVEGPVGQGTFKWLFGKVPAATY